MNYSLPEFLAHAIALEREAQERYHELADMMEAHLNLDTAKVFRDMVHFSKLHGDEIAERAKDVPLRKLNSWEFRWRISHEVGDDDGDGETGLGQQDGTHQAGHAGAYDDNAVIGQGGRPCSGLSYPSHCL